jgi:hypothetical protein
MTPELLSFIWPLDTTVLNALTVHLIILSAHTTNHINTQRTTQTGTHYSSNVPTSLVTHLRPDSMASIHLACTCRAPAGHLPLRHTRAMYWRVLCWMAAALQLQIRQGREQ